MKVILEHNKGFNWVNERNIYVKGLFFDQDNHFHYEENLIDSFKFISEQQQFIECVKKINGILSVIIINNDETYLYTDKSRFFPLFYTFKNSELIVSDEPTKLLPYIEKPQLDRTAVSSFLGSGFVIGNRTLAEDIFQVQPGEFLIIKNDNILKSGNIFTFKATSDEIDQRSLSELKIICSVKIESAIKRLIELLQGKTAVIPLSGGFDSRLIATALKKNNYKKVICFTYGKSDNPEVKISEKVAEKLGYPWYFIEYTPELINNYVSSKEFMDYYSYCSRFVSMFYMQEFFATKYLRDNALIPKDAVFLPGHSGDLLAGSQLIKVVPEKLSFSNITSDILNKKFFYNKIAASERNKLSSDIDYQLSDKTDSYYKSFLPYSIYEDWDIKEKIAKFNINSSHVFSFFNYQVYFPFWDNELMNFFRTVPFKYKKFKKLYDEVLADEYFKPLSVFFENESNPKAFKIRKQVYKDKIKKMIPDFINRFFSHVPDEYNYKYITGFMLEDSKNKGYTINSKVKYYNAIIIQWYLWQTESLFLKSEKP